MSALISNLAYALLCPPRICPAMMTDTRTVSMLDKHLPLAHEHSRPSSAASASTSTSTNSSPFSSPQSPVTSSSLPSLSASTSATAHNATFDDFLKHLNLAPTITSSSLSFPSANPRKADPLLSPLTPPFTAESSLSQSSSFSNAPTVTSSLTSSPRLSVSSSYAGRPQAIVPPLLPSHRTAHHRDFVHSAHLPQQQTQQQQQSSNASHMMSASAVLDDDDDLSAAWNGHSALSFDSVDDYEDTDFQLAAQQMRVDNAAKQLLEDMAVSKAARSHIRSVSVSSTATSSIIAPPGFHFHNQQQQHSDAAAELASHLDSLALHRDRDWDRDARIQPPSLREPTSNHNHYQLYSGLSNSQTNTSYSHKLHQQHHSAQAPSLAASFPAPLHSQPVSGPANGCNLYVDQLPIPFSEHDLRTIFAPFGHIEKLRVAIDPCSGTHNTHTFTVVGCVGSCDEISQSIL